MNDDDIDDLVRDDTPIVDDEARARARSRLRETIEADRVRLRRRHRTRSFAVGAAAVLVAMLVLLQVLLPPGKGGPTRGVAAQIRQLGLLSEKQPLFVVSPSQFLYVRTEELRREGQTILGGPSFEVQARLAIESWLGIDGSGSRSTTYLEVTFPSAADQAAWEAAGEPSLPAAGDVKEERFGPGELAFYDVADLPIDPVALKAVLEAGSVIDTRPREANLLSTIGVLLAQETLPVTVRQALFEVAAGIARVTIANGAVDPLGRAATKVSVADASGNTSLYFDANDASVLAQERTHPATGGVDKLEWQAYTLQAVVDKLNEAPLT